MKSLLISLMLVSSFMSYADADLSIYDMNQESKINSLSTVMSMMNATILEIEKSIEDVEGDGYISGKYIAATINFIEDDLKKAKKVRADILNSFGEVDTDQVDLMIMHIETAKRLSDELNQ
jgi:hypothetical protein